jgi:NitT/TauT family transport system substrate-binding protein
MVEFTRRQVAAALCLPALIRPALAQSSKMPVKLGILKMAALTDPYIAQKLGMFEKHGLDVTFVEFNAGGEAIAAGQGGSVDLFLAIPGTVMTAVDRGFDMLAVFQNEVAKSGPPDSGSVQVNASSNIHTLADLKGKKVAVSSLHSQNVVSLQMLMKKEGIDLNSVTWLEIPFPSQADMLRAKQVDAVATVDPYTTQLQTSGVGRVISWNYVEYLPKQPLGAWFAKRSYINRNPKVVENFNASIKDAIDYMNSDAPRARAAVTDFTGLAPDLVKNMPMIGWDYHVSVPRWQEVADMMLASGEISRPHKAEDFLAPQIKPYIVEG